MKNNAGTFVLLLLLTLTSCNSHNHSQQGDVYTCPMHPTVTSDKPGTCPVCGMDLVRKGRPGEEVVITPELSNVMKSPDEVVVASVRTVRGEFKALAVDVAADGIVTYDTRKRYTIPAKTAGRLEKVYLTYEFQPVRKGQKVAEVYSPELSTAQRELVFLLESDPGNAFLIDAARRKLELLGMAKSQIDALVKSREVTTTISVYSPYSGYVTTGGPPPSLQASMTSAQASGSDMNGMTASPVPLSEKQGQTRSGDRGLLARPGDYVSAGQTLFTVVDAESIRIELNLPGTYTQTVRVGTRAQLDAGGRHAQAVTIDFVQPFFSDGQQFTKLRVYAERKQELQIGSLVNARIQIDVPEALWVPRESVLDLGTQRVVFVQQRGVLKPKVVQTGITSQGMIEIRSGLATSEEIAADAQYLVDSESFIKPIK